MAIHYTFHVEGGVLRFRTWGFDESREEVEAYGVAVIAAALEAGAARILCDERELEYRLGTFDTYRAAEYIAATAPRVARIALVCDPRFADDAQFWENVVVNRGLSLRFFQEIEAAERWLAAPK